MKELDTKTKELKNTYTLVKLHLVLLEKHISDMGILLEEPYSRIGTMQSQVENIGYSENSQKPGRLLPEGSSQDNKLVYELPKKLKQEQELFNKRILCSSAGAYDKEGNPNTMSDQEVIDMYLRDNPLEDKPGYVHSVAIPEYEISETEGVPAVQKKDGINAEVIRKALQAYPSHPGRGAMDAALRSFGKVIQGNFAPPTSEDFEYDDRCREEMVTESSKCGDEE